MLFGTFYLFKPSHWKIKNLYPQNPTCTVVTHHLIVYLDAIDLLDPTSLPFLDAIFDKLVLLMIISIYFQPIDWFYFCILNYKVVLIYTHHSGWTHMLKLTFQWHKLQKNVILWLRASLFLDYEWIMFFQVIAKPQVEVPHTTAIADSTRKQRWLLSFTFLVLGGMLEAKVWFCVCLFSNLNNFHILLVYCLEYLHSMFWIYWSCIHLVFYGFFVFILFKIYCIATLSSLFYVS